MRPALLAAALLSLTPGSAGMAQPPATPSSASTPAYVTPPVELAESGPGGMRVAEAGVFGNYFPPPPGSAGRAPGVLVLGGSEGGLSEGAGREARLLAAHGFAVLQLAYFGAPGLPHDLKRVPLETFARGLAWLRARPETDPGRTAVVGTSKGAEAALLVAADDPKLTAVIAASPSSVVWPGIDFTSAGWASSWTRGGEPLAYLRYGHPPVPTTGLGYIFQGYAQGLKTLAATPAAAIPLERVHARVMLVCGGADALWPSCPMADALRARLPPARSAKLRLLRYPDAGHTAFGPPVPPSSPHYAQLGSLGGTPDANAEARADAWPKALAFLDAAFVP